VDDILKSIRVVTNVMESLVKRVIVAESEAANEKEKVRMGLEELRRKTLQVETMSAKVEEMEKFAVGTNGMLNEMRQRIEDMVLETTRQRQRAAENEQELSRVKQDFESLRTYVSTLVSVRETLLSSEKQFETMEKLFDRYFCTLLCVLNYCSFYECMVKNSFCLAHLLYYVKNDLKKWSDDEKHKKKEI